MYLEGVAEELLSSVERHVLERMRIDLDDAVVNGDASVPVNPAAGLDALHQKTQFVTQGRVIGNDVDAQRLAAFIRQHHQLSCCQLGLHVVAVVKVVRLVEVVMAVAERN